MSDLPPSNSVPAVICRAVTPSDTASNVLRPAPRAFYIGVSGDVTLVCFDGSSVLFAAHPVGYLLAGGQRIAATGTTATNIVALT